MSEEVVVIVAGGPPPDPGCASVVPVGARVIAADEGLDHAGALGLDVREAIGDFDSVSPSALEAAERRGVLVERHPAEKDATDLELALDRAVSLGARRVLVLAGDGGRMDHLLAGLLLLASDEYSGLEVDAHVGTARVHVVRGEREFVGEPGELLTLLALGGPAVGVRTEGLLYALDGDTLEPGSTRGVSNLFAAERVRIELAAGVLLAVRPGSAQ